MKLAGIRAVGLQEGQGNQHQLLVQPFSTPQAQALSLWLIPCPSEGLSLPDVGRLCVSFSRSTFPLSKHQVSCTVTLWVSASPQHLSARASQLLTY